MNQTFRLGLIALLVALVAKWVLERHTTMADGPRDLLLGVLFGIAIGCMLLGLWRMKRRR